MNSLSAELKNVPTSILK